MAIKFEGVRLQATEISIKAQVATQPTLGPWCIITTLESELWLFFRVKVAII
jgi:hypothetical protein